MLHCLYRRYIGFLKRYGDTQERSREHNDKIGRTWIKDHRRKGEYFKESTNFLGYTIEYKKIKPDHDRTQGISEYLAPTTVKEFRRFIGLLVYERRFLEGISETLGPLYELTKKRSRFSWTTEHMKAFNEAN